ncbi:MAG: ParB N-terminal domain-containing protein [Candidatus Tectomicrobia bacterium]|uniref:Methyltransferase n=1 Tax=Tectimicrobiota bacterium TaxID=2528274 RepID=A0A932HW30_UNCTE|nr:ParB N-terminal domain-containing protein [Candidatus Tectomicrobia bacterium]
MEKERKSEDGFEKFSCGHAIEYLPIASFKPNPKNPRTHSREQVRQIARSIKKLGFTNPLLIAADNRIIAGHGRFEAAKLLGMKKLPAIRLEGMTEVQIRAYILADNKLALNAGWDEKLLALEFRYLHELEIDFNLELTGFETAEIDNLFEILGPADEDAAADAVPEIDPAEPAVSLLGDFWCLGRHRLLCGDATQKESYRLLMGEQLAQLVITDPPFNVPIGGHVSGLGRIQHAEFAMASGEMSKDQFIAFLYSTFVLLVYFSVDGAIHFIFMDWRHLDEILAAAKGVYPELKNLIVWNKTNAGMGTFYRSQHELIFAFKKGDSPHINNFELGQHGRHRSNVWTYAGANTFREGRQEELALHPTVKPVAMIADAILDCSKRGGIVLDPFAGSGTTLIAAEKTGRKAYAMDISSKYVDTAIRRWEEFTGEKATLAETGQTFSEVKEARANGR